MRYWQWISAEATWHNLYSLISQCLHTFLEAVGNPQVSVSWGCFLYRLPSPSLSLWLVCLDLYVCLDNQRLIWRIATKRNSHARCKQLLYRYIYMVGTIDLHCHSQLVYANCISLFLSIDIDLLSHVLTDLISIRTKGLPVECWFNSGPTSSVLTQR